MKPLKQLFVFLLLSVCTLLVSAREGAPDAHYYDAIEGLQDSVLKSTLGALTYANFTTRYSFGSGSHHTWDALYKTDRDESDNSVLDMYSNNKRYFNPSAPTASVKNCDIEHMFPNSWWGAKAGNRDAYEDIHHLVPADYSANRSKSDHGPGVPTDTTFNNGLWVNGKTASIIYFCPPDEYKGDFARAWFYIATTYGDTVTWQGEALPNFMTNDDWHEFLPYTRDLLLQWHRDDPVSEKELKRMYEVYLVQGNRNPFIDYPCLAEYIWGNLAGNPVHLSQLTCAYDDLFSGDGCAVITVPTIISPFGTVHTEITGPNMPIEKKIKIKGALLTSGNLTLTLSGANASLFSLSTTSISESDASAGKEITITYTPTAKGNHTATLIVNGCGVTNHEIPISGTCINYYTATWMADGVEFDQSTTAEFTSPQMPENTPANCQYGDKVFVGWTAHSNYASATTEPDDLFPTWNRPAAPELSENTTFYAVYAVQNGMTSYPKTYSFDITTSDFNGTSYAANNNEKTTTATTEMDDSEMEVHWTSYNLMKQSGAIMWKQKEGYIYNSTNLGTVTDVAITSTGGEFTTYYGTSVQPSSGEQGDGKGYFQTNVGNATGYVSFITVTFQIPIPIPAYINYEVSCYAPLPEYTVTFMNNGVLYDSVTDVEGATISGITDPTCEDYTFVGWSTGTYAEDNTELPTIDYTGTIPSANTTYNAVFSNSETTPGIEETLFAKITSTSDISNGKYLIVYQGTDSVAFDGSLETLDVVGNGIDVTITNDTIAYSNTLESSTFTITATEDVYTVQSASGYYIGQKTDANNLSSSTTEAYTNTISFAQDGSVDIIGSGNARLRYNKASNQRRFRYYKTDSYPNQQVITLYKKVTIGTPDVTTTYYTTSPTCNGAPTEIDILPSASPARKVLMDGKLYIILDNQIFDATGRKVQ